MTESGYYPSGAEFDPSAPFNEEEPQYRSVEVDVTLTLHKKINIDISENYLREEFDKKKGTTLEYYGDDLNEEVCSNVVLPNKAYHYIQGNTNKGRKAIQDLKDWEIEDINSEIILKRWKPKLVYLIKTTKVYTLVML